MSEKENKCNMSYVEDEVTGWKLKLEGDCNEIFQKVDSLSPGKRRYLKRRMIVDE